MTKRGGEIAGDLAALGIEIDHRSRMYPAIFARATRAQVGAIAADPRILRVGLTNHHVQGKTHATEGPITGPTNTMSVPRLTTFKTQAFSAANQAIGLDESGACALYDEHISLHFNAVAYQENPRSCTGDGDCGEPCGFGAAYSPADDWKGAACISGRCITRHAAGVAGSISSTTDFGYGAYRARLFYANRGFTAAGRADNCSDDKIDDAYQWYVANGVTTVVESWGCVSSLPNDADGPLQDWYSRYFGITTVRAGGNEITGPACPYFHNGLCVGGTNGDGTIASHSWRNPGDATTNLEPSFPHHDREEPDVVALSENVLVPSLNDPARALDTDHTWWTNQANHFPVPVGAVNFAAPAVGAAVALLKDACNARQPGSLLPQAVVAIVKAAAYLKDPSGDGGYSSGVGNCPVGAACDRKDGAGLLYGDALLDFCGLSLTGNTSTTGVVDLNPAGDPAQYSAPTPSDPKYGPTKAGFGLGSVLLHPEETLRDVIAWQDCPHYKTKEEGNTVTDFDLWLYNRTTNTWVAGVQSTSYDDNTEGFEFKPSVTGTYEPIIVWKSGQPQCGSQSETVVEARVWGKYIPGPPP